jgi:hypothetical protein
MRTKGEIKLCNSFELVTYNLSVKRLSNQSLRQRVLFQYQEYLLNPGQIRAEKIVRNTMTWPGLIHHVEHAIFMFHLSIMSNHKEGA